MPGQPYASPWASGSSGGLEGGGKGRSVRLVAAGFLVCAKGSLLTYRPPMRFAHWLQKRKPHPERALFDVGRPISRFDITPSFRASWPLLERF